MFDMAAAGVHIAAWRRGGGVAADGVVLIAGLVGESSLIPSVIAVAVAAVLMTRHRALLPAVRTKAWVPRESGLGSISQASTEGSLH